MQFRHPSNDYTETVRLAWLWTLLLGPFYLAFKRAWGAAILMPISTLIVLVFVGASAGVSETAMMVGGGFGFAWFLLWAGAAERIVARAYQRRGSPGRALASAHPSAAGLMAPPRRRSP